MSLIADCRYILNHVLCSFCLNIVLGRPEERSPRRLNRISRTRLESYVTHLLESPICMSISQIWRPVARNRQDVTGLPPGEAFPEAVLSTTSDLDRPNIS